MIRQIVQGTKSRIPSMIAGAFLLPFLALAAQYAAYNVIPATYWLSYSAITPFSQPVAGEAIQFVSTSKSKAGSSVSWLDILRCESADGTRFSRIEQVTGDTFIGGTDGQYVAGKPWTFPPQLFPATCTIETNYTIHLPLGVEKKAQFESEPFNVQR